MNLSQDESNSTTQQNSAVLQNLLLKQDIKITQDPELKQGPELQQNPELKPDPELNPDPTRYNLMPFTLLVPKKEMMEEIATMQTQNYPQDEQFTEILSKQENPVSHLIDPAQLIPKIEIVSSTE